MDDTQSTSFHLKEDLEGRIANLAMAPSYSNTLIPLFEAIMNSIHAVEDRFNEGWEKQCQIDVEVFEDKEGNPYSFIVKDNGIGLNNRNFDSFLTYDSRAKIKKGGKGIGRLTWLKVFNNINISSVFEEDGLRQERNFSFVLDNNSAIQNHSVSEVNNVSEVGTSIELKNLNKSYSSHCPKNLDTIAYRIAAHFLPFLIGDEKLNIRVKNSSKTKNLANLVETNMFQRESFKFEVDTFDGEDTYRFTIENLLLNKILVESKEHTVYLSAHRRVVKDHNISNQTGLKKFIKHENNQTFYIGILSSKFLDNNVTQERNNFDIPKDTYKAITEKAEEVAREYLKEEIENLINAKADKIDRVVKNFPRYSYLVQDSKEFAKKLPLNKKTEEEIYREMSVYDYRASQNMKKDIEKSINIKNDPSSSEEFREHLDKIMICVDQQKRASLAEYVGKRKLIIDLLESRLGYEEKEKQKPYREEAIHSIICPLNITSNDIEYRNHNLWLIDDRLAYYDFWASDKSIRSFIKTSEAKERPDLILFKGNHLLCRPGTDQPVVIIEFKRPGLKKYTEKENPVTQIYNYIRELRDHKIKDKTGALITEIDSDMPFFCYLVCDITSSLKILLENYGITQTLPGGRGYFGYNNPNRAYVEILQYSHIVKDARLRHEAFFNELGIN